VSQQQLFFRQCSLIVGSSGGPALDLSQLRIKFKTRKSVIQTPNILEARVYNLADATVKELISGSNGQPEFNQVVLQAGYENGPYGVIFSGEVRYFRTGRESPTDTFLEIYGADGDKAYNYAVVSATLPQGSKLTDGAAQVNSAMSAQGVQPPPAPPPDPGIAYPRGKVMFGMARDYADKIAGNSKCQWSIQQGTQQYLPRLNTLPGQVIQVNSATGMIGMPVQTIYGIEVRMLIDPRIHYGSILQINNKDIQTAQLDLSLGGAAQNALNQLGPGFLNADGYYKVIAGEYDGDTRGNNWFLNAVCVNMDNSSSVASIQAGWLPGP
jgi:hypothetical protein